MRNLISILWAPPSVATCYRLNVLLLKSHTLRPNPHCISNRKWGHREGSGHEDGAQMKGISALIKGTTRLPHLCHHIRPQESDSHQTEFFSTLTWTFPASKTMRKKLLLFLSHQRWSPVTAAWTDTVLETNTEPGRKNFQLLPAAHSASSR